MSEPNGHEATRFALGSEYLQSLVKVLPESKMNTVFIPRDIGDLPRLMGSAMGILDANKNTDRRD